MHIFYCGAMKQRLAYEIDQGFGYSLRDIKPHLQTILYKWKGTDKSQEEMGSWVSQTWTFRVNQTKGCLSPIISPYLIHHKTNKKIKCIQCTTKGTYFLNVLSVFKHDIGRYSLSPSPSNFESCIKENRDEKKLFKMHLKHLCKSWLF